MTALIWDLDGTLLDSYGVFMQSLAELYSSLDLPFDAAATYKIIKNQSVDAFLRQTPGDFRQLHDIFSEKCARHNDEVTLMSGAREVLEWTKQQGIRNFVYTHKGSNTFPLLAQLGVESYFTEVLTSQSGFPRKPDPTAVNYLVEKYHLDKHQTYYIGDRPLDIELAYYSGISSMNFIAAEDSQQIRQLTDLIEILKPE